MRCTRGLAFLLELDGFDAGAFAAAAAAVPATASGVLVSYFNDIFPLSIA
jgi:hypothetical protein